MNLGEFNETLNGYQKSSGLYLNVILEEIKRESMDGRTRMVFQSIQLFEYAHKKNGDKVFMTREEGDSNPNFARCGL